MKLGVRVVLLFLVTLKFLFCFFDKQEERNKFFLKKILGIALQFSVSTVNTFLSNMNFPIFMV